MIVLTATTDNLQAVLAGSITTNHPQCVTSWRDITTTDFTPGRTVINTNNTTDVNIVAAPAASTQRVVDLINIYNKDTVAATVTVKFDANGTEYILWKGSLAAGESVQYVEGRGWQRLGASGIPLTEPGDAYIPGGTDVAVPDGGTGASTAAGARTNLDVDSSTRTISAKTSNYAVVVGDDNKIFTNTGAAVPIDFTLPASAGCTPGKTKFRFVWMEPGQAINIVLPGSDTLVFFGERNAAGFIAAAGTPAIPTGEYAYMDVLYMGGGVWNGQAIGQWSA